MKLTETEKKLLALAMDRSASDGEIGTAALKLIELLRRRYQSGYELIRDLEQISTVARVQWIPRPDPYASFVMPFGKHRGRKLKDIPVDYLFWLLDNYDDLRESTRAVIENYLAD